MSRPRSRLLEPDHIDSLVGVIDLKNGFAVHAVAGNRDQYQPIEFPVDDIRNIGDAPKLARYYRDLGLTSLYLADLDAIRGKPLQRDLICEITSGFGGAQVILDIGWRGDEAATNRDTLESISRQFPQARFVAASESAVVLDAPSRLAQCVGAENTVASLDYRDGVLLQQLDAAEADWFAAIAEARVSGAIVLDIASVGTGRGASTIELCRRYRQFAPEMTIYSGGGIRDTEDIRRLRQVGCDRFLVATALLDLN